MLTTLKRFDWKSFNKEAKEEYLKVGLHKLSITFELIIQRRATTQLLLGAADD